jgi:2'-5' RNA ligase
MANWFIALPVAPGRWFDAIEPPPLVRKFGAKDLHLTVAFLGPVTGEAAAHAFEAAAHFPLAPLPVRLGGLAALGARARPSAFSALLTQGREEVERAIGTARGEMFARAKARPERRPPLAHVTLARPKRNIAEPALREAIRWAEQLQLDAPAIQLDAIALYTWSDERERALFRIERSLPLHGAACTPPSSA